MTAIPCACLGIFMGGLLVKKLNLSALGAIRMAMLVNLISTACYVSFLFLGCDTGPVAGVTISYDNRYKQFEREGRSQLLNVQIKIPFAMTHEAHLAQFNQTLAARRPQLLWVPRANLIAAQI